MAKIISRTSPRTLRGLLGRLDATEHERFWSAHYLRAPYLARGGAADLRGLVSDAMIHHLIECTGCDLTAVRDGRVLRAPRMTTREQGAALQEAGYSLVFRHVERHDHPIAVLGGHLVDELPGVLDAHLYLTPAGGSGFGWHYDAEEVFILQTDGSKELLLRANSLHASPLPESMPHDLGFERETSPVVGHRLEAGDWLYIPSGWWHHARAGSASRSVSLGLLVPSPLSVLDELRRDLVRDPAWRRRLRPGAIPPDEGGPAGLGAALAAGFAGRLAAAAPADGMHGSPAAPRLMIDSARPD